MRSKYLFLVAVALSVTLPSFAVDGADRTARDQAFEFIKKNLIGHRLETKISRKLNDALFSDFHRVTSFANLTKTDRGLTFDSIVTIKQKLWDLEGDVKKEPARNKDRDLVAHYSLSQKESTGELTGYYVIPANSLEDSTGNVNSVRVSLKDDALTLLSSAVLYQDHFAGGDKKEPGASDTVNVYSADQDGLLKASYTETAFSVDPKTLERTPKGEANVSEEKEVK